MMAAQLISPHISGIQAPDVLKSLPGWLIWRFEHVQGEVKPRKVPYYTNGGKRHGVQGRAEDRAALTTFEAAKASAARKGFDGVGIALMPEFNVTALDFDDCVTNGVLNHEVEAMVANTYAEYSPSGNGVRAFVRGNLGNEKSHATPSRYGFEVFSSKGFVTFTGNRLAIVDMLGTENEVSPPTDAVLALHKTRFTRTTERPESSTPLTLPLETIADALAVLDPSCSHDQWLKIGMGIHHDTGGSEDGFRLWDSWSSDGEQYPGQEALAVRWDSFGNYQGPAVTIRTLVHLANEQGARIDLAPPVTLDEFSVIGEMPSTDKVFKFKVEPAGEFIHGADPTWIIQDAVPQAGLGVMFGESGSGKSFMMLDMCIDIALGQSWRGLPTRQCKVVYVAAEGGSGFRKRLKVAAHKREMDLVDLPVGVINAAPNLMQKADIQDLVGAIQQSGGAGLVVIDTLAQTTPGANENSSELGVALAHCRTIHSATGAMVMLVHHSGKDSSKGARGWSGLRAAADVELEVLRSDTKRVLTVTKQKDGEDGQEWGFELETVEMDKVDGTTYTSCVVVHTETRAKELQKVKKKPLGEKEKLVIEVLKEHLQPGIWGVERDELMQKCIDQLVPGKGRDSRKYVVKRAIDGLILVHFLEEKEDRINFFGAEV